MRKSFFLLSLLVTIAAMAAQPKYIFYFIGDGMGVGQVMSAQTYNRLVLGSETPLTMMQMPVNSLSTTYSASSPVTDSAAAGTALATGSKTKNGMLGMTPDTIAVNSVAKTLHDNGYGIALLTTVAPDDATPGAFYAHVPSRSMYYEIGKQAAESGYEIIGGSGLRGTVDKKTGEPNDLIPYIESRGVKIVRGVDALRAADNRRVILLPDNPVWEWNAGYNVDNNPGALTLEDMTVAAIEHLGKYTPEAFFIMAEGGNIDHAGHANDGGAVIKEVLAFDRAIARAMDFYKAHPDETLIIVTADHETGGMSVGNNHTGYNALLQYITPQKMSKERFTEYCTTLTDGDNAPTWEQMKQFLSENLGLFSEVPVPEDMEQRLSQSFYNVFVKQEDDVQKTLYADFNRFAVDVYDVLNLIAGIGWNTTKHTGNPVPVYAIGAGQELFIGGNDNIDIPAKILKAANLQSSQTSNIHRYTKQ